MLVGIATSSFAQIPTNGLVGYYPFNGNANDESTNINNGTVNGASLITDRFGNPNSAYQFDGTDDYIYLGQNLFNDSVGTITFWFNADDLVMDRPMFSYADTTSMNNYLKILGKGNTGNPANRFQITHDKRQCQGSNGMGIRVTNDTITPNTWNFAAIKVDGDSTFMYLNCNKVASYVSQNSTKVNGQWFSDLCGGDYATFIGRHKRSTSDDYFKGILDDIRIYNRPLDSLEMSNVCNEGLCYQTITVTDTLLINTTITGYNPITYQNTIKVYPNPTNDHITIDNGDFNSMGDYTILIKNSLGQTMFQSAINQQQFYINLSTWSGNGIYFLHLIDNTNNIVDIRKIVLQ